MTLKILGVCGAQGALLHPFLGDPRFEILGNIDPRGELHTQKEEQWKLNFGDIPFLKRDNSKVKWRRVDIIVGSPTCGYASVFSYSRAKHLGAAREDKSLNLYLNMVKKLRPKVFLMENLPALLNQIPIEEWERELKGYEFVVYTGSVTHYGNSQESRNRLVLIGTREKNWTQAFWSTPSDKPIHHFRWFWERAHGEKNYRDFDRIVSMYDSRIKPRTNLTFSQVKKMWRGEYKDKYKWPMPGTEMTTLPGVYKMRPHSYPVTVRPSDRQFNHLGRQLGLEELKLIMGFPESFKIYMCKRDPHSAEGREQWRYWMQKGRNTITKGAVYEVGEWFHQTLKQLVDEHEIIRKVKSHSNREHRVICKLPLD